MCFKTPYIFYKIVNIGKYQPTINNSPNGEKVSRRSDPNTELITDLSISIETKEIISQQCGDK